MYNVFLEEKRQRERAESNPVALSHSALKRREILAQRYRARLLLHCSVATPSSTAVL
jgi:hypothetical protein